jgi:hypothetical protein
MRLNKLSKNTDQTVMCVVLLDQSGRTVPRSSLLAAPPKVSQPPATPQKTTSAKPALTWRSMSSQTGSTALGATAVGWEPRATAKLMVSWDHSSPQSAAMPRCQLKSWLPNGCDIVARADSCSSRFSFFFFVDSPLVSCMGVITANAGSSAKGSAFLVRWSFTIVSRCWTTAAKQARISHGQCKIQRQGLSLSCSLVFRHRFRVLLDQQAHLFFMRCISFASAAPARTCTASRAGAIFWAALRGAVLWMGHPGAHVACIAAWGARLQLSLTNLASQGFDSSTHFAVVLEGAAQCHEFPKEEVVKAANLLELHRGNPRLGQGIEDCHHHAAVGHRVASPHGGSGSFDLCVHICVGGWWGPSLMPPLFQPHVACGLTSFTGPAALSKQGLHC